METVTRQIRPAVDCRELAKTYGEGETAVQALRGIDLEVRSGELMMLVGPSGCGKTTLISIIAGILLNFGLAVALGVLIGSLVAGQTFYNFTLDNLRHYGALKAMGISYRQLIVMVLLQAATVAVLGYCVGAGFGSAMGWIVASQGLAFSMPWQVPAFALAAILSVCALAAWLSLRRVFRLEPAVVFKA